MCQDLSPSREMGENALPTHSFEATAQCAGVRMTIAKVCKNFSGRKTIVLSVLSLTGTIEPYLKDVEMTSLICFQRRQTV